MAEAHLDDVYRYVLYLTGDRNVAEDLTNATFERALHRWSRFDPKRGSAKTWLCQLARGAALDHFRAEQRRRKREETYAARIRCTATASPPRSTKHCRNSLPASAKSWRFASCSSWTATRPPACSASARPRARPGFHGR